MLGERLLSALEEGSRAELIADLQAGRAQLWIGEASAMVTEVVEEPARTIHVWLAAGAIGDILAITPGVAAWGRAMGCKFATVDGRKGWERVLRPLGFAPVHGILRKAL